jgi:hypothetical protein
LGSAPAAMAACALGLIAYYTIVYRAITSGRLFMAAAVSPAVNPK